MPTPDPIEAALSRLMPPALSESGQRAIEAMLDELAAAAPVALAASPVKRRAVWYLVPFGIAATLAALLVLVPRKELGALPQVMARTVAEVKSGLVLVGESDRIEAMSDEGWMADEDGTAMQAVRIRVVEANTLRDEASGIVVQVSDPREEMILMPLSVF
jgi:hypothetical protein